MKLLQSSFLLMFFLTSYSAILNAQSWEIVQKEKEATLNVHYFENEPYAYKSRGNYTGIEMDILNSFVEWLEEEKGVELKLKYTKYNDFRIFYSGIEKAPENSVGLGSVTIDDSRKETVDFSAPYLNNVAVLITDGSVPTSKNEEDLVKNVLNLKPVTIKGSSHQNHLKKLYSSNGLNIRLTYVPQANMIPEKIKESPKFYGYMDIISYWQYVRTSDHYVKMHSIANIKDEQFGFVFPKGAGWDIIFNEFFESGFGFTATKEYHEILEKHLGFEIIEKVELD